MGKSETSQVQTFTIEGHSHTEGTFDAKAYFMPDSTAAGSKVKVHFQCTHNKEKGRKSKPCRTLSWPTLPVPFSVSWTGKPISKDTLCKLSGNCTFWPHADFLAAFNTSLNWARMEHREKAIKENFLLSTLTQQGVFTPGSPDGSSKRKSSRFNSSSKTNNPIRTNFQLFQDFEDGTCFTHAILKPGCQECGGSSACTLIYPVPFGITDEEIKFTCMSCQKSGISCSLQREGFHLSGLAAINKKISDMPRVVQEVQYSDYDLNNPEHPANGTPPWSPYYHDESYGQFTQ